MFQNLGSTTLKVAYISHSLVAQRQAFFAAELERQLERDGGKLLQVYPNRWHHLERGGGFDVSGVGDLASFCFPASAWMAVKWFRPDVMLVQQEAYSRTAGDAAVIAKEIGAKLVIFSWENASPPLGEAEVVLRKAAARVYGNGDAFELGESLLKPGITRILPQVGFDPDIFTPVAVDQSFDVLFCGRKGDPMKGEAILDAAVEGEGWRVGKTHEMGFAAYEELAARYSSAVVQCVPSLDVPGRAREQFAPAVTIEGLLCGLPVVTTDQAAIVEWTNECPGLWRARQDDAEQLMFALRDALAFAREDPSRWLKLREEVRRWAMLRFSNKAVAQEYVELFREVLQ